MHKKFLTLVSIGEGTTKSEIGGTLLLFTFYPFILSEFFFFYPGYIFLIHMFLDKKNFF